MKTLWRNLRPIWYCRYKETVKAVNDRGQLSGLEIVLYHAPVQIMANVSRATGQSNTEQFGNLTNYDKVIVTNDIELPVDESSVFFLDKEPEFATRISYDYEEPETVLGTPTATPVEYQVPIPDYTVAGIAKSLNSISIAARKVELS